MGSGLEARSEQLENERVADVSAQCPMPVLGKRIRRRRPLDALRRGVRADDAGPVIFPPVFASFHEHILRSRQPRFWWLYVAEILERHYLADAAREPVAGVNPTHPDVPRRRHRGEASATRHRGASVTRPSAVPRTVTKSI